MTVLVVGAGPAGLMAAAELARRSADVACVDAAAGPSPLSRALLIWPRTLELLRGVVPDLDGMRLEAFNYYSSGRAVARLRFDATTRPVVLPQPALERALHAAVKVQWGTRLVAFEQDERGVDATLSGPDGAVRRIRARYLIGCDGAGSTVRTVLRVPFEGSTYPSTFLLADARIAGDVEHGAVHYHFSSRGVLVLIGLPDGRFRVFTSASPGGDVADLQRLVDERGPGRLRLHDEAWTSAFAIHARQAARYRVGRVFLAGDAAHAHSPAGGQGLNTGIGDAHNLAWKLARVLAGRSPEGLLETYEPERAHVARSVIRQADWQTRAWLLRGRGQIAARDAALRLASRTQLLERLSAPRLAGLRTVYPGAGRGRRLRAGALAPAELRRTLPADDYALVAWGRRTLLIRPDHHIAAVLACG